MATYIRWKETAIGDKDQFLVSMFSTLSPDYYPVNIIGSGLYDILSMYAEEFVDLYNEVKQTYDDLSIDTVRTTLIEGRTFSKMYDNFGVLYKSPKRYDQYYDTFSTASVVQSYRQQLRFLAQAFLAGMSITGIERVGHAFTGIAPLVEQHIKANPRWILTAYTGSVIGVGDGFILADIYIPRIGNVLPLDNSGIFSVGDNFSLSFTHLGTNTKLSGEDLYYNTVVTTYFTDDVSPSSQSVTALQNAIEYQSSRVVRADQQLRVDYNNVFSYYRPYGAYYSGSSGIAGPPIIYSGDPGWIAGTEDDLPSELAIHSKGFLYNIGRLHGTGSIHETPVLDLGSAFDSYRWYYDWLVSTREYGSYDVEVRQYSSASIPSTLYYIPIVSSDNAIPPILTEDTGSIRAHWFNVRSQSVYDAVNDNSLIATSVPTFDYFISRNPKRYCFLYDSSVTFKDADNTHLNFSSSLNIQAWMQQISSATGPTTNAFEIRRESSGSYYKFYLNTTAGTLHFALSNSVVFGDVSVNVKPYIDINDIFPHYFAVSYVSGSVRFFVDGNRIGTASITSPSSIPSMPLATQSIILNAAGVGIDEILISDAILGDDDIYDSFIETRPRYTGVGIPSGSVKRYHQARFTLYGYNTRDVELHQFNIRGVSSQVIAKYLNPYYNYPYILPIFKKL